MEKNVEKIEEISKLAADSLGKYKKDILNLLEIYGAKSEEKLLHQAEGFLEEELKKGELSQESKNEILNLLKKGVSGKKGFFYFLSRKLGIKVDIKDKDSIRKMVENKGLNFDELWDSYIKYLCQNPAIKLGKKDIHKNEEKVKESVSILKDILKLHKEFEEKYPSIASKRSKIWSISFKMFRNAIRTDIPIVLLDEGLQKKIKKVLDKDDNYKSLVKGIKKEIEDEIRKSEPTNGLVYIKKFGRFIYREIGENSDTIYCRIPIKSFGKMDLQFSIGKVDAYIVYEKDQNGIWKGFLFMDDLYDFPEGNIKSIKGMLNGFGHSLQKNDIIMPYHWRIQFKMPDITEKDIKRDYSVEA